MPRSTIALAMMAHNEARYLPAVWEGLKDRLSGAVILSDPPNDDDTMKVARKLFGHLPGRIAERPWPESAAKARNEVLNQARGLADYVLWLDPDSPLTGKMPATLTEPFYGIRTAEANMQWAMVHLIRSDMRAEWRGRAHEYLDIFGQPSPILKGPLVHRNGSGGGLEGMLGTHIPGLLKDIAEDPYNPRWPFYLARTYEVTGQVAEAIVWFMIRATMPGGFDEETYLSVLHLGRLHMGRNNTEAEKWLLRAFAYRPNRWEALTQLAYLYDCTEQPQIAEKIRQNIATMPETTDTLFVESR